MKKINYKNLIPYFIGLVLAFTTSTSSFAQAVCPTDLYVSIQNESNCDTIVNWVAPVDVSATSIVQIEGPVSGSVFTPGNYTISYEFTYPVVSPDTCSFIVHVFGVPAAGLGCNPVNVSLDENCMMVLSPYLALADTTIACIGNYVMFILDENLIPITDTLTSEHVGNTYMYMVGLPNSGFSCMNTITVEDKLPPTILCENDTVACNGLGTAKSPIVQDACTGYTLVTLPEVQEIISCNTDFIGRVTRMFYAIDDYGNHSDTCEQVIMLRRVNLSGVDFPANRTTLTGDPLSCSGTYAVDYKGHPMPSVTGVPSIGGDPIFPTPVYLCNAAVNYEDVVSVDNGCLKRILRRWSITEWWCSGDSVRVQYQTIDIVDDVAPVITCPDDMIFSTSGHDCTATVNLPALNIIDNCNSVNYVSVEFGGNTTIGNGGTFEVPVGVNTVTYTARDNCNNESTCSFEITVTDLSKPVAICLQNTVTSLTSLGTSFITADMVDNGSYDDCKLDKVEIRRMGDNCGVGGNTTFGNKVYFCCADVGNDVMVVLRVTDVSGNWNECMVSVEVQNKILPKITFCPANQTIDCTDFYNPDDLGASFGNITVSTQCDDNYTIEETSSFNLSSCNIGTINRTMELKSLQGITLGTCNQTITVVNSDPFDGFTEIGWPLDYEDDNMCSIDGLHPDLLASEFSYPVYSDDVCTLLGESYEDEVFLFTNGQAACFKIIRHWSIIDWCQESSPGTYQVWNHEQILKVTNSILPEFTAACQDQVVETVDCNNSQVTLVKEATDDCTSPEALIWRYKIDLQNDNIYDATGVTNDASGEYPLGIHRIVWTVRDGCGGENSCTEFFEVKSTKTPIAIAHDGLSAALVAMDMDNDGTPETEMVMIEADFFNKDSYHSCGYAVTFSFSADVNDTQRIFGCDDLGEQAIQLWVTDTKGNQSYVNTYVIIEDTNDIHICPEGFAFTVSGRMITENQLPIQNVHVMKMEVESETEDMTNVDGIFSFENINQGIDLMIEPIKDHDDKEGVSTLDLLLIQRHILKLGLLDSPYKLIAADINGDEKVNGLDLIKLRKLILGKISSIEDVTSWKFVDARYEFIDAEHPWDEDYKQSRTIEYLYGDKIADFIGVKIGDVNNTAMSFSNTANNDRNNIIINLDNQNVLANQTIVVPVKIQNDENIKGFQFALSLEGLKFVEVRSNSSLNENNFSVDTRNNTLNCSWNNYNASTSTVEFELVFESNETGTLSSQLNIDNNLSPELYSGVGLNSSAIAIVYNEVEFDNPKTENINLSNSPNPFSGYTEISFELTNDQDATISFYDVSGRLLEQYTGQYIKGMNKYTFDASGFNNSGLILVKLETADNTFTKKMMITK